MIDAFLDRTCPLNALAPPPCSPLPKQRGMSVSGQSGSGPVRVASPTPEPIGRQGSQGAASLAATDVQELLGCIKMLRDEARGAQQRRAILDNNER